MQVIGIVCVGILQRCQQEVCLSASAAATSLCGFVAGQVLPARVCWNFEGMLLAATVKAVAALAGATSQLSFALLPDATITGNPTTSVMCCIASSMGLDHDPAGTPNESETTAGLTAFSATQSKAAGVHAT
jgi:hypothetical protein